MDFLILVLGHLRGSCPLSLCGLAWPKMLASGIGPASGVNRARSSPMWNPPFRGFLFLEDDVSTCIWIWWGYFPPAKVSTTSWRWSTEPSDGRRLFLSHPSPPKLVLELLSLYGFWDMESQLSWPQIEVVSLHLRFGRRFVLSSEFRGLRPPAFIPRVMGWLSVFIALSSLLSEQDWLVPPGSLTCL